MSLDLEQLKRELKAFYNIDNNIIDNELSFNYKGLNVVKRNYSNILIKDKELNDIDKNHIHNEINICKKYNDNNFYDNDIQKYQNILNNNKIDIKLYCLCYNANNIMQNLELYLFLEQKLSYYKIKKKFYDLYNNNITINDHRSLLPTSKQEKKEDSNIEKRAIKELSLFVDSLKNQLKEYDNFKRYSSVDLDFNIFNDAKQCRYFNIENIIKVIEHNLKYTKDSIKHSLELKLEKPLKRNIYVDDIKDIHTRQVLEYDLSFKPIKQDTKIKYDIEVKNSKAITHFTYDFVQLENVNIQILNILDDQFLHKYRDILPFKSDNVEDNNILSITFYSQDKKLNTLNLKLK